MTGKALTLLLLPAMVSAVSCSVKEYRDDCPCYLSLDLRRAFDDIVSAPEELMISVYSPENCYRETFTPGSCPDSIEIRVPRGEVTVSALTVRNSRSVKDRSLLISYGDQADSIYAFSAVVDTGGEQAREKVDLHKQYSTVYLKFLWPEEGDSPSGIPKLKVKGSTNGLSIDVLAPSRGAFCLELPEQDLMSPHRFRIPRQSDKSLALEIYDRGSGKLIDSIALGDHIDGTGYDWNAVDLKDIYIEIDYTKTDAVITVKEWDGGDSFRKTI